MLESIILGIISSSTYNSISNYLKNSFGIDENELKAIVTKAGGDAAKSFFEKYDEKYNDPTNTFLARESNWQRIFKSFFYSEELLSTDQINPNGFKDEPDATEEEIKYFIKEFGKEIKSNHSLDKIITEKTFMLESKKAQGTILNGLNSIQQMISEENKKEEIIFIDTFEDEGWLPQQGKIYRRASPDGPKMQYMIKGNLIFFEMELKDGKEWYIVVDFKGMVHDMVLPYPVEEYTIEMPDDLIIETQKEKQQNGYIKVLHHLKWGGRIMRVYDPQGKQVDIKVDFPCRIVNKERKFILEPPYAKVLESIIDINLNSVGGFFTNTQFSMDSSSNLIDRNKVAQCPAQSTEDGSIENYIWIVPLERDKIPREVPTSVLPQQITNLASRLEDNLFEEIDVNYDGDKIGGGVRFFAKRITVDNDFQGSYNYQGDAIVIKKLN